MTKQLVLASVALMLNAAVTGATTPTITKKVSVSGAQGTVSASVNVPPAPTEPSRPYPPCVTESRLFYGVPTIRNTASCKRLCIKYPSDYRIDRSRDVRVTVSGSDGASYTHWQNFPAVSTACIRFRNASASEGMKGTLRLPLIRRH